MLKGKSSKGYQRKWKKDNKIIKLDAVGYQSISEVLISHFLAFTELREYRVPYYPCLIEEEGKLLGSGCFSYDFKPQGKTIVTAGKLLEKSKMSLGISYYDFLDFMDSNYMRYFTIKDYIDKILCLDAITWNDDRHFFNIAFLEDEKGILSPAPIYDNGEGCLADMISYPFTCGLAENLSSVVAKPFAFSFTQQLDYVSKPILLDKEGFLSSLNKFSTKESIRALDAILAGLSETEGKAWESY